MYYRQRKSRVGTAFPPVHQITTIPASVGGVNALDSLMMMPPQDCIYCFNLMPSEYGQRVRAGYQEWATNMTGAVRTVLPYESSTQSFANDRLWAVTSEGLYDVTNSTSTPVLDANATFTVTGDGTQAGFGVHAEWTDDSAEHYLFYADAENGIWQYTENPDEWSRPVWLQPDPADPDNLTLPFPVADVAFVAVHKQRIWVILKDSTDAWYSPVASVAGTFRKFTFGAKMEHGGFLQGLFTWSVDGGDGLNDYLVGVSRGGDVLVYRGSDPALTDWELVGSWFIGETPRSRRIAYEVGSDMYILSVFGISSIRDLLQGVNTNELRNSPSAKVNRFLRADVIAGKDLSEWQLTQNPSDGFFQIVTPRPGLGAYVQYAQNINTKAWGFWEGVPMTCADSWNGDYYFGAAGGILYVYTGDQDGVLIDRSGGVPVNFRSLTSFQSPDGEHGTWHQVGVIRGIGVLTGSVSVTIKAIYDYDIDAIVPAPPAVPTASGSLWDSAIWDADTWGGGVTGGSVERGTLGFGRVVAIAISGQSIGRGNLVGYDYSYRKGNFL